MCRTLEHSGLSVAFIAVVWSAEQIMTFVFVFSVSVSIFVFFWRDIFRTIDIQFISNETNFIIFVFAVRFQDGIQLSSLLFNCFRELFPYAEGFAN